MTPQSLFLNTEQRHGYKHAQRERCRRRERIGWRLITGNDRAERGQRDEQKERAQKADIFFRVLQSDIFDLFLDASDDNFQKVLPAGPFQIRGKPARDEL